MAKRPKRCYAAAPAQKFTPREPPPSKSRRPANLIPDELVYSKGRTCIVLELSTS